LFGGPIGSVAFAPAGFRLPAVTERLLLWWRATQREGPRRHDFAVVEREPNNCAECGRQWLDPRERWRVYLDDEERTYMVCPQCAEKEFDSDDRD